MRHFLQSSVLKTDIPGGLLRVHKPLLLGDEVVDDDAQNADVTRGMQGDLWALDAQAQGTGRFGGDVWGGLAGQARQGAA